MQRLISHLSCLIYLPFERSVPTGNPDSIFICKQKHQIIEFHSNLGNTRNTLLDHFLLPKKQLALFTFQWSVAISDIRKIKRERSNLILVGIFLVSKLRNIFIDSSF